MTEDITENVQVLIVGGGIAGLTAAQELADRRLSVLVAEKAPFFGGHAGRLACKATDRCLKCNDCLVEDRLKDTSGKGQVDIRLGTEVEAVQRNGQGFRVTLRSRPAWIDPAKCTNCGICLEKCPEQGAILSAPTHYNHPFYAIDPLKCTYFQGNPERVCQSSCPEGAIDLDAPETTIEVKAEGIILASGYTPFDPEKNKRFQFHQHRNMVSSMELEDMLRTSGSVYRPSDGEIPGKIAFIQCVGSRDPHLGHDYCSRVCCGYALRMAMRIAHDRPETEITFFYMDIQNFGKDFERTFEAAKEKINLKRGLPGDFYGLENDAIQVNYYDEEARRVISGDFDLVILSVGMAPARSHGFFRDALGISLDTDGFLMVPAEASGQGIIVAGSAAGPMDVGESISHAKRAALEMGRYIEKGSQGSRAQGAK